MRKAGIPLSTCTSFSGMLVATGIGVFFIPLFFTVIRRFSEPRAKVASVGGDAWRRLLIGTLAVVGCAGAPAYVAPSTVSASTRIAAESATNAPLFDSLARAAQLPPPSPAGVHVLRNTATAAVYRLVVLRDTTLVALVRDALQNNQDLRVAVARVNEYRAMTGTARRHAVPRRDRETHRLHPTRS